MPQVKPTGSPPGTALLVRCGAGGLRLCKGDGTPNPGLLDSGHSATQTKAGLSLPCALKTTCRKLASGASLSHRPTQRPSAELTTGPKFQLKHTDHSQAAPLHKGQCRPGQLTWAAVRGWACTWFFLFPSWQGAGPFPQPSTDMDTSRCPALCTAVLEGGPGGSFMGHMPCSGAVLPLPEPRVS